MKIGCIAIKAEVYSGPVPNLLVACHYVVKTPTVELDVPTNMVPKKVAYLRKSCVHGFLKNEAGIPLGPFRSDVAAE